MNTWENFFNDEANQYLDNCFTKNTDKEIDFIINELKISKGDKIIDIGCGTGRHSIKLAELGYKMTGIDISEKMLNIGRDFAKEKNLSIEFIKGDASKTRLDDKFDCALCICEGAFSIFDIDVDPYSYHESILKNISAMLKPKSKFLLTALNGFRFIRSHNDNDIKNGMFNIENISHTEEVNTKNGKTVKVCEKGFLPYEIKTLLQNSGFKVLNIWGGSAGSWNKEELKLDEMEIMVLSEKI